MANWKIPVHAPYRVTSDAGQHNARASLCGIDFITCSPAAPDLLAMTDAFVKYRFDRYNPALAGDFVTEGGYHTLGRFVVLQASIGDIDLFIRCCHNEILLAGIDDFVKAGDKLGVYGNTGRSCGAHVHADFWVYPGDAVKVAEIGLDPTPANFTVSPWPGSATLVNVNPTRFLRNNGLDVINNGGY